MNNTAWQTWWAKHVEKGMHDGLCETCDAPMKPESVIEGDLGFYCSAECLSDAEEGSDEMSDTELRRHEAKQMGLT